MSKENIIFKMALLLLVTFISSCNRTQFKPVGNQQSSSLEVSVPQDPTPSPEPTPVPPVPTPEPPTPQPEPVPQPQPPPPQPPEPPPVVIPPAVLKSGACANNSSTQLLSCMKCLVPMNPPAPAQFSEKGQSLIDVMTIGCAIPNKSAPKNYVPPTKEQLITRLNRLSPKFYPDSPLTAAQKNVIEGLKNDPVLQKKMFAGLWYQPPYSDAFETYFGVAVDEMVYQICYQSPESVFTPYNGTALHSKEYMDCISNGNSFGCKEKSDYTKANQYRDQLRSAMRESISNPYVAPPPTPAKKCSWESFEGNYEQNADQVLAGWLVSGYKVGIEIGTLAGKCEVITALPSGSNIPRGPVKMSGYICK